MTLLATILRNVEDLIKSAPCSRSFMEDLRIARMK